MLRVIDDIDRWAEKQAKAIEKQGHKPNRNMKRVRQQTEYNKQEFNKLFKRI